MNNEPNRSTILPVEIHGGIIRMFRNLTALLPKSSLLLRGSLSKTVGSVSESVVTKSETTFMKARTSLEEN